MILVAFPPRPESFRASRTCAGIRSTSPTPPCTSAGSRAAPRAPIRSVATKCARSAGYSASRSRSRRLCSRPNADRRSRRPAKLVERAGERPSSAFSPTRACLRLRVGQQGARYASPAGLSRASEHPAYGALHRAVARSVQRFLEGPRPERPTPFRQPSARATPFRRSSARASDDRPLEQHRVHSVRAAGTFVGNPVDDDP